MKNWEIIAIIVATAVATAAAVAFICQKVNRKRRLRFDSEEFENEDYSDVFGDDEFECGEQCGFCKSEDLDVQIPDDAVDALAEAAEFGERLAKAEEDAEAEAAAIAAAQAAAAEEEDAEAETDEDEE